MLAGSARFNSGTIAHYQARGASPEQAISLIEEDLSYGGLTAFDRKNSQKREEAVALTIEASLKYLTQNNPERDADVHYRELAVFPDDIPLELAVLADL